MPESIKLRSMPISIIVQLSKLKNAVKRWRSQWVSDKKLEVRIHSNGKKLSVSFQLKHKKKKNYCTTRMLVYVCLFNLFWFIRELQYRIAKICGSFEFKIVHFQSSLFFTGYLPFLLFYALDEERNVVNNESKFLLYRTNRIFEKSIPLKRCWNRSSRHRCFYFVVGPACRFHSNTPPVSTFFDLVEKTSSNSVSNSFVPFRVLSVEEKYSIPGGHYHHQQQLTIISR